MNYNEKYDEYLEKLLLLQFDASQIFEHNATKGSVREGFIKQIINSLFANIKLYRGFVVCDEFQSSQLDIIAVSSNSNPKIRPLGSDILIDIEDVKIIVEVKSKAKTSELLALNLLAENLKRLDGYIDTKIGMFMYDYEIKKKTMLKKFGFRYDSDLDSYLDELEVEYKNIDFIISLDPSTNSNALDKSFFLIRDITTNRFVLYKKPPMSKYFFDLFKS